MLAKDDPTTRSVWRRFISGVLLIALIVGSLVIFTEPRTHASGPTVAWSKSEEVTLTGYGKLSPMVGSNDPITVVLSHQQVNALNNALVTLRLVSSEAVPNSQSTAVAADVGVTCHENSLVFTLEDTTHIGEVPSVAIADFECPAPGMVVVQSQSSVQWYRGLTCHLDSLIAQDLPPGSAKGTLTVFKHCSAKS